MSSEQLDQLLQECLSAYETGLSPEECLSAFPEHRAYLEPLFRQALSLRVAFAAAPSEEFRSMTRERFLFAAGRDVTAAMASEPDPDFLSTTRQRLRNAAGAGAQEALRNVAPPRLPFWVNTRRKLLEAAAAGPAPTMRPVAVFMRVGLSAAVVVLAMTLAGLAYFTTENKPTSVGAQLADIEEQLTAVENQRQAGQIVPPGVLIDLSRRTNDLVQRLNELPAADPVAQQKLPDIIERQQAAVEATITASASTTELEQVKQQLEQADQGVKLLAARADATSTPNQSVVTTTTQTTSNSATTTAGTPVPTATPVTGQPLSIRIASDTAIGLIWIEIKTSDIRFVVPDSWEIGGVSPGPNGIATLTGNYLSFKIENATILIDMRDGEVNLLVGSTSTRVRAGGPNAKPFTFEQLIPVASTLAPQVHYFLDSLELPSAATATPTPSSTPTSTATSTSTTTTTTTTTTSTTSPTSSATVPPTKTP